MLVYKDKLNIDCSICHLCSACMIMQVDANLLYELLPYSRKFSRE